ncbi:hypothetical protein BB427_10140 [Pseudoalteromonas sp. BMB]|nr:hypothetical protein BB427_10140 [Pseudoalteromonas sp. BMB]
MVSPILVSIGHIIVMQVGVMQYCIGKPIIYIMLNSLNSRKMTGVCSILVFISSVMLLSRAQLKLHLHKLVTFLAVVIIISKKHRLLRVGTIK